ncbi:hypothetical protein SteCoe_33282 [Stentor coeruleus]|uniref:Uncharacterized protein n=1 Tax=Stentor coeruleus TaxID=5963 RepID=A0A1R2AXC7_9CILI|nr:hypothetical protein SteCoe_33282 [Stentor coeruleus]
MEVTESLLTWLHESNVLKHPPIHENRKLYIHELDAQAFECGLRFVPLISRVIKAVNNSDRIPTPVPEINSLKDTNSSAAKLYNWNILIKALESIDVNVDSDMKALIIAGDRPLVADILKAIYLAEITLKSENHSVDGNKKRKRHKFLEEGALLLNELDVNIPLNESENTLEFLVLSFCKSFNVNSKTAAGLLVQSGKFLTQILTKGLKGKTEPVISWYSLVSSYAQVFSELISKEKSSFSVHLVLNSLKSGLLSKDFSVVQKCCDCLVALHTHLAANSISCWEWFSTEAYSIALKAYDTFKEDVTTYVLKLLVAYGKNNLKDVFGQMLISNYSEPIQCFNVISSFWGYVDENSSAYDDLQTQGLVDYWAEFGLREAEKEPALITPTRVSALGFLCDVWLKFAKYIEQHEDSANSILTVIKRACREKSKILKIICYGRLFLLLSDFSMKKNSYAPIIFKTLTFALVENYAFDRIREFLIYNFLFVMEDVSSLPVSILIEPYIKQTQVLQKPKYSTADFDFYVALARHPKLTVKDAIVLADSLGKIYYSDFVYANSAEIPLVLIIGRFIDEKPMQEFIGKFIGLGLKILYAKMPPKPKGPAKEILTKEEYEEEKILNYYKKLVLTLTEKVIHLENSEMNVDLKEILIKGCVEVKKITGSTYKGLKLVLDLLGDSSSMIEKYENKNSIPSSRGNSATSRSIVSYGNSSHKRNQSMASRPRERALSDIEKVKRQRREKEYIEKSQSEMRRREEQKKKKVLRLQLEQRKIFLGLESKSELSHPIVAKEIPPIIEMPIILIEDETQQDQEIIQCALKKFARVFRAIFNHYANTGYKIQKFSFKAPFENMMDKKTFISDGETVKMLRDHGISNTLVTTEEIKRLITWFMQKMKLKGIELEYFPLAMYYIAEFIYTRHPVNYSDYPPGICLLVLMNQFSKSLSKIVPQHYFTEPDYGVGDRDVIKMLNSKIKQDPELNLPEGFKKVTEKDLVIEYKIPKELGLSKSAKAAVEILDDIIFVALKIHIITPVVKIVRVNLVKGMLVKPEIEAEDKKKDLGVPINRAVYKIQPLPAYMNFTPGIKLEVARLQNLYPIDLLQECARCLDDLICTTQSKSFEIISRNPKPAGSIINKAVQQRLTEEALIIAEKHKTEAKRKLHKQLLLEQLKFLRSKKEEQFNEEVHIKSKERELEELKKRQKLEQRTKEKQEIERKIREFKIKKEEEETQRAEQERDTLQKLEEKKRRDREEFLKQAKRKLLENMNSKKEQKEKRLLEMNTNKNKDEIKIHNRKLLLQKLVQSKMGINKERNLKDQVCTAMIDSAVNNMFNMFSPGLDIIYQYFCKLAPVASGDQNLMSLAGYAKFVSVFAISPSLVSTEESVRIFKGITKNKTAESGINSSEFKEILVTIAISGIKVLEKEANKKLESYGALMNEMFMWISIPMESKKATELVKKISNNTHSINPRDKKRNKNLIIKELTSG